MLAAVPEVVAAIESYDITSVRASVGNYLVCKHIAAHTDIKVVFNGDGSDEVRGAGLEPSWYRPTGDTSSLQLTLGCLTPSSTLAFLQVSGSYLYFYNAPGDHAFERAWRRGTDEGRRV